MMNLDLENSQKRISASGKNVTLWKARIVALRVERNGGSKVFNSCCRAAIISVTLATGLALGTRILIFCCSPYSGGDNIQTLQPYNCATYTGDNCVYSPD
jgi:hypothetical protein